MGELIRNFQLQEAAANQKTFKTERGKVKFAGDFMSNENGKPRSLVSSIAILLRNTTWKCGKVERLIVDYLRKRAQRFGKFHTPVKEMLTHFRVNGKKRNEFLDAIRRLEKRRIIKIEISH